jgi:hypothetical protein
MATNYPTGLDTFVNPASGNTLDSPSHSLQHSDINDAVEAMQRKVGVGTAVAGSASAGQVLTISAAGTSTWSTPTPGALVQVVPTSVAVGSGSGSVGTSGAVTFSGASSITVNGCFSGSYTNYKILIDVESPTADAGIFMKLRTGVTDSSTSYFYGLAGNQADGTNAPDNGSGLTDGFGILTTDGASTAHFYTSDIFLGSPFTTKRTTFLCTYAGIRSSGVGVGRAGGGWHDVGTSYESVRFIPSAGNISGTIRVYAYSD